MAAVELCCPECFDDTHLREEVFPLRGAPIGACDFCLKNEVPVLPPRELQDYFEAILEIYEPAEDGLHLIDWLRRDWLILPDSSLPTHRAKDLLVEILDDGDIGRRRLRPLEQGEGSPLSEWDGLRQELKHSNRWFISNPIDPVWLRWAVEWTRVSIQPSYWYRARLQRGAELFPPREMGAPPCEISSHGRANPAGIPYLYLSSEPGTAIAEVRPHTGDFATVAKFRTEELVVADLISPRSHVTPFSLGGSREMLRLRRGLELLDCLGQELTRPVLPHNVAVDYVPSQYVCEFIKSVGCDGVQYRSALSAGVNLALFDPSRAKIRSRRGYSVKEIVVGSALLEE